VLGRDIDLTELRVKLGGWLQQKMPEARDLALEDVERSGAGFANVSLPFTLHWREAGRERTAGMLFRGAGISEPVYPDFKLDRQFRVMRCLQDTAVPVPRVYWMERDEGLFGFPFYLMSRIDGDVPSEFPPYHSFGICRDATPEKRARMWWGTLEAMAGVHALDWKSLGLSFLGVPPDGRGALDGELDYWEHYLDWAKDEPQPILEVALRWLRDHKYAPPRVSLCWGDARLPNTIFGPGGEVRGLLDWDMAILSDPVSDLAFILTLDRLLSVGTGVPRLPGFPDEEETVRRYEEMTGRKVENFFYNQVFAALRAGVVILRVQKNLERMGIELPGEDPILDNMCTRLVAELLELPAPGVGGAMSLTREDVSGTIQLHLTGPGGGDWTVASRGGTISRRAGAAADPDATVTIRAEDWAAIQRGETNPFNAWTGGRLKVTGDGALFQQLADAIVRAWEAET
jgi:aminoglycoside phosphotransferase (APT) family kinase protein/putative sterol carrier protein